MGAGRGVSGKNLGISPETSTPELGPDKWKTMSMSTFRTYESISVMNSLSSLLQSEQTNSDMKIQPQ